MISPNLIGARVESREPSLASVPAHWQVLRVKDVGQAIIGLTYSPEDVTDQEGLGRLVLRAGNIQRGELDLSDGVYVNKAVPPGLLLRAGDIVICARNGSPHLVGKNAVATADVAGQTWGAFMAVLRSPHNNYLRWVLNSQIFAEQMGSFSTATINQLTSATLHNMRFALPPEEEQRAIADYLDRETARIDTLIEEQQRLIEMLVSRKSAVVDAVVTRGLDADSCLVDSGVDWIGPIPEGWQTRPLWSMFRRIKDVDHPEEQMLSVFRDYGVVAKDSRDNINKTAENRSIYQLVHPGWLVTNRMKAWQGSVGISPLRGIVSGHYICFAPLHSEDDAYLNWLFRSPRYALGYGLISRGVRIGQAEIDNDQYRVLPVVVPPLEEQRRIAAYLEEQTAKIDALIAETERFIQLAHERRAALITAAVTGQIDVREMA